MRKPPNLCPCEDLFCLKEYSPCTSGMTLLHAFSVASPFGLPRFLKAGDVYKYLRWSGTRGCSTHFAIQRKPHRLATEMHAIEPFRLYGVILKFDNYFAFVAIA